HLHQKYIRKYEKGNLLIEFLTLSVPIFYVAPRYILKGTDWSYYIEIVWEFLAVSLLVLAILKSVYRWYDRQISHTIMARKNEDVIRETDRLIANEKISNETFDVFHMLVKDFDAEDKRLLNNALNKDKQEANRFALKNLKPGTVTSCTICGANPWVFRKGSCDACGGTPVYKKN
ncbi:MAG: hypothetical protein L3V56_14305, partial [Candidatus Magnetoovum sp. WYHC-5]|nr:hypothetical protein [Candidatus Magnetoovum sp. WYHC-5]